MNHTQLESRFQQAIWQQMLARQDRSPVDFYRVLVGRIVWAWPSLTIITLTLIGGGGVGLYGLMGQATFLSWGLILLGGGLLLEVGWVWVSLYDETRRNEVRLGLIPAELAVRLDTLTSRQLRVKMLKALQIWGQLDDLAQSVARPIWREQVAATQARVLIWLQAIYTLAHRLDQTQVTMAQQIKSQTLPGAALDKIRQEVTIVERQLDQTLQKMATVYAKVLLVTHQSTMARNFAPIQAEIGSEIERLQDLAEAIREMQGGKVAGWQNGR